MWEEEGFAFDFDSPFVVDVPLAFLACVAGILSFSLCTFGVITSFILILGFGFAVLSSGTGVDGWIWGKDGGGDGDIDGWWGSCSPSPARVRRVEVVISFCAFVWNELVLFTTFVELGK